MAEENIAPEDASAEISKTQEELSQELKQLIETAKNEAEEAKKLLVLCTQYEKDSREIKEKIQADKSEVDVNKGAIDQTTQTITDLEQKASQSLTIIEGKLVSVEDNIQKMETAYTEFEKINTQILDPSTGLSVTLSTAQELKGQIETAKTEADISLKQITEELTTWNTHVEEMNDAFVRFQEIQNKVFDQETGLTSILANAAKLRDEILKLKTQSEIYDKKAKDLTDNIEVLNKKAEEDSGRLSLTLKAITTFGLGDHFEKRTTEIKKDVTSWGRWAIFSILLLALAVLFIFGFAKKFGFQIPDGSNEWTYILYRIAVTSPFLFFSGFCIAQYSKEKDLLDRYGFKAVKGFTLETYTTTLNRTFNEKGEDKSNESEIMKFVLEQMRNIYEEPFHSINKSETKKEKVSTITSTINDKLENGKRTIEESTETEQKVKE